MPHSCTRNPIPGLRSFLRRPGLRTAMLPRIHRSSAVCVTALLCLSSMMGTLHAQDSPQKNGFGIRNVSVYFDYYSSGLPNSGGFPSSSQFLPDAAGGGGVQLGWRQSRERSTSSLTYTVSVIGRIRYSELNAQSHALSFTTSRKLTPRWVFVLSTRGDISSQAQSLFSSTTSSNLASVTANFDDLAAAILTSKFANPQLASVFNNAPLVESPVRNLLYGDRMLMSSARTSLSYSYSPRLSVSFSAGATRIQRISEGQPGSNQNSYLIPNTTTGNVGLVLSYSLSPHTQLGGSVTAERVTSSLQDIYNTTSLASLGWSLARRWVLQIRGGAGISSAVRQSIPVSTAPSPAGGGSLTFKTLSQTFSGSFDRTRTDPYGLGSAATSSAGFSWRWNSSHTWWLESSMSWQRLQGGSFGNTAGLRTTVGFGRRIQPHLILLTQYAYQHYSALSQTVLYGQNQSAIRVSLMWEPYP